MTDVDEIIISDDEIAGLQEGGRGKWAQAGVPHKGWTCVDCYDDGEDGEELSRVCEMCETTPIRWVHVMEHPDWPGRLEVGKVCAAHMSEDYEGAQRREADCKSLSKRRERWLVTGWKRSNAGNPYKNKGPFNVVVFNRGGGWSMRVERRETGQRWALKEPRKTAEEAALAAFEAIVELEK
jgi:hypothetical protein